ncbi:bifunctional diguanylate cyclase/phosphodiesterase [Rhodopseudomonas boonkerdii]|uniref:bifunctional diguanylate cyclase/phosphodiesterase n=1 Tax=Rhodopseudomonas boonkerdii TaxID=475937 RepID=UPI001E358742|nr:bifunctional diguanylate cyclase/phosphodiesterase [Rhodopseudomonas boonkerdii]UGV28042.1 bifunctional diguanylate cyclase/phosphodiesterase [Rhodopseudomonas boonkerdii]
MLTIYNCIANAHDLRLVGLAAVICAIASVTAVTLLRHARNAEGGMSYLWLGVSAISTGFGIWATHFVAMLAFTPGIPSGYNIVLTAVSLVAAILLTGTGLAIALIPNVRIAPAVGGSVVAGGIAAMHYTGMAAFEVQATMHWDVALVISSIVVGGALGALALPVALHSDGASWRIGGALLLTLAICSHHFTAMSAVTIIPDSSIAISPLSVPAPWLALGVALISFAIIGLAVGGIALDIRDRRRTDLEADRMLGLANAAIEGLIVCDGDTIVTVNNSFAALACASTESFAGKRLDACFPDDLPRAGLISRPDQPVEASLRAGRGLPVPVELIQRQIDFAGRPHQVIAVRDLRARKEAEQHIRFLAHHDALTGLSNRSYFNDRVDAEIANMQPGRKHAILCLDLDRFKEVNDLFGHAAGDNVLQTVAAHVGSLLDDGQVMARLGGDEFAILMPNIRHNAAAEKMAQRVLEILRERDDASELGSVSSSIGIALYPDDADDRESVLAHADTALYRAKSDGRATYRFYETGMGDAVRDRRMLEHDLRGAVAGDQMSLVYQPQEGMQRGAVIGFEALLRWTHPTRGMVSPAIFIPIAEETGSILEIGEWVMRTACTEAARWKRPLTIAVNVSAVQIYHDNFVPMVHQILLETGLVPSRLELEITETALIRDLNRALSALRRIKALGVRIAMDDFGTGYSSLSNLRAFPFDKIKIDGSFIKSVNNNGQAATIVRAVVGLGRGLGLPVLAEGVETEAELKFLNEEKCDEVQGYLLGKPASIDHFAHVTEGLPQQSPISVDAQVA